MSTNNNLGYIFIGQDDPKESPKEKGRTDMATSNIDLDGDGEEKYEYGKYAGPVVQLRIRQPIGPDDNEQGFVGNICWGKDPDSNMWTLFVKVQKEGDVGKKVEREHKGQWFKIPLLPHRPDDGSEA